MIQKKGWLSQLQLEEIGRHLESGGNNVEAKIEEQNPTATEPIRQVTEEYIAQNEEDEVRDKENPELLINYNNIETIEKKKHTWKIADLMKKDHFSNPSNLRRIDRVRLKEKKNLWMKVQTLYRQVTLPKTTSSSSVGIVITQLLGIKEIKKQEERRAILEKNDRVK